MAFVPAYILILLITILIDYYAGIKIEESQGRAKQIYLVASVVSTCMVLFVFKYVDFFIDSVNAAVAVIGGDAPFHPIKILLPIGLSFHTFQSLGYVIEVYRGTEKAERHLGIYALYVMFFPQLVAGPIERPHALLPQLRGDREINWDRFRLGVQMIAWGLFKKMVIADRLADYVDAVYGNLPAHSGPTLYLATVFFAFQIYCDFSGYSDIAIGSAQMLGVDLMKNFRSPYLAVSIIDFWRRWHISLTSWFRDYLYIPLGGNRAGQARRAFNLFVVFLVSGLWHGASWTFVAWGAYHGVLYTGSRFFGRKSASPSLFHSLITFHLALLGWVFFRAATFADAWYVLFNFWRPAPVELSMGSYFSMGDLAVAFTAIAVMIAVEWAQERPLWDNVRVRAPVGLRWALYYALFFAVLVFGHIGAKQFIYFQF